MCTHSFLHFSWSPLHFVTMPLLPRDERDLNCCTAFYPLLIWFLFVPLVAVVMTVNVVFLCLFIFLLLLLLSLRLAVFYLLSCTITQSFSSESASIVWLYTRHKYMCVSPWQFGWIKRKKNCHHINSVAWTGDTVSDRGRGQKLSTQELILLFYDHFFLNRKIKLATRSPRYHPRSKKGLEQLAYTQTHTHSTSFSIQTNCSQCITTKAQK